MNAKLRNLVIIAAVLVFSVVIWGVVAAQDATSTAEPNPTNAQATAEPMRTHAFLGVQLQDSSNGVTIVQVVDGSGAATAGLKVDDILTSINGTAIKTSADAGAIISALNPGDQVTVIITRGGSDMTITATLGAQPNTIQMVNPPGQGQPNSPPGQGRPNGPGFANRALGITYSSDTQSWTIANISQDSPLYTAGLRQGDMIKTFDGKSYDPASLATYLQSLAQNANVTLSVDRSGASQDITVSASDLMAFAMNGFGIQGGGFGDDNGGFGDNGNGNGGNQQFNPSNMLPFLMFAYGNGYLGVTFQTIDAQVAQANNLTVTDGALITAVDPGSPADKAGLKVNDIVTAVDGDKVDQERTLRDRMIAYEPGDTVTLTVLRDGASQDIQATLAQPQMPDMGQFFGGIPFNFQGPRGFRGQPDQNGQNNPMATPEATPNL